MVTRQRILGLIPHQGDMCLLEAALDWSALDITCSARSHLSPANPLRRGGKLHAVCGIEYGLQAAALHGALLSGSGPTAGYLAALRDVEIHTLRLDEPSFGTLRVAATQERCTPEGLMYRLVVAAEGGEELLSGLAIMIRRSPAADAP
jgi:predicted hotdog family 3-hydroxylacyl-ACP dehydratase